MESIGCGIKFISCPLLNMPKKEPDTKRRGRVSCGCFGSHSSFEGTPARERDGKNSDYAMVENVEDMKARVVNEFDAASFYTVASEDQEPVPGEKVCLDNTFLMGSTVPHESSGTSSTCWRECEHDFFNIRVGPDYKKRGLKCPSLSYFYEPFGLDVLRSDVIISNVAPNLMFPPQPSYYDSACGLPAVLIVNTQLPLLSPSIFSSSDNDPGWSCIGYYRIRKEAVDWGLGSAVSPPAVSVFKRMLARGFSDRSLAFKAIGMVSELEKQNLPMAGLIAKYNGKPVLVTASSTFHKGTVPYPYLEIDYNVRKWSLIARTTLVQLSDQLKNLTVHVGYLVEATENEDLPERMLGGTTVRNLDLESAKFVKFD